MKILHESELATVIHGDARDVLPTLATKSVDLLATDPPYGEDWQSGRRAEAFDKIAGDGADEADDLLREVTPELVRVVRGRRHIYTFGLALDHPMLPEKARAELVWDKGRIGSGNLSSPWGPAHEPLFFHVRAPDVTNARQGAGGLTARLRKGSVLTVKRLSATQVSRHPTEKPVDLMRQIVESSSLLGDLVLDPFAGVGSTGVAAVLEGRRCLLVEVDEEYAEIAAQRITEAEAIAAKAGAA